MYLQVQGLRSHLRQVRGSTDWTQWAEGGCGGGKGGSSARGFRVLGSRSSITKTQLH